MAKNIHWDKKIKGINIVRESSSRTSSHPNRIQHFFESSKQNETLQNVNTFMVGTLKNSFVENLIILSIIKSINLKHVGKEIFIVFEDEQLQLCK